MPKPRIALIHALRESLQPIWDAFAESWPEAEYFNLLDDSLAVDRERDGRLTTEIEQKFLTLGRYAAASTSGDRETKAILFTCSAFGPAIDAVKRDQNIPVLRPNEAAFEAALARGSRIGLVVTFGPSLTSLSAELKAMAPGRALHIEGRLVEGALAALQGKDRATHDRLIAEAVAALPPVDAIVLGQFSMSSAAKVCPPALRGKVLTTPDASVARLKQLLG